MIFHSTAMHSVWMTPNVLLFGVAYSWDSDSDLPNHPGLFANQFYRFKRTKMIGRLILKLETAMTICKTFLQNFFFFAVINVTNWSGKMSQSKIINFLFKM